MAIKLTRLTHKIAIQLHSVAESCTICSSRSRWPVRKLLDTPSYLYLFILENNSFERVGNFSLRHRIQNGSGAHPAYPMGTRGSSPGDKAVGA
jgi:hypothetical protein